VLWVGQSCCVSVLHKPQVKGHVEDAAPQVGWAQHSTAQPRQSTARQQCAQKTALHPPCRDKPPSLA
jgi:hypothetical protein